MTTDIVKVEFDGDQLECVREGDDVWLNLRRACDVLGLDVDTQRRKLKAKRWARTVNLTARDAAGRKQPQTFLHLKSLAGWLFEIEPGKVAPGIAEKLERYQADAADELYRFFFGQAEVAPTPRQAPVIEVVADAPALPPAAATTPALVVYYEGKAALERARDRGKIDDDHFEAKLAELLAQAGGADIMAAPKRLGFERALPAPADLAEGERFFGMKAVDKTGHYSAGEIGRPFGLSAQAVGAIADEHNLKGDPAHGKWSPILGGQGQVINQQWLYSEAAKAFLAPHLEAERDRREAVAEAKAAAKANRERKKAAKSPAPSAPEPIGPGARGYVGAQPAVVVETLFQQPPVAVSFGPKGGDA